VFTGKMHFEKGKDRPCELVIGGGRKGSSYRSSDTP
jgi:hypothetical protein